MTAKLVAKGWEDFQHYKDRSPPWIKLHKKLLDNFEFHCLPDASRALAPMLWLLASEFDDGAIPFDMAQLAFRLRQTPERISDALKPLIDKGFFCVEGVAIELLAERKPDARLDRGRDRDREETEETPAATAQAPSQPPADFLGDENLRALNGRSVVAIDKRWELPEEWGVDAESLGWKPNEVVREAEKFRQYWTVGRGQGKRRSVKGWRQSWSNWLSNAAEKRR